MTTLKGSIVHGIALSEEPGIGALTLAEIIRELAHRHGEREALAAPDETGAMIRWSYNDLYQQSRMIAKSLIANGLNKGARVGVLMSNSMEWVAAMFGTALAGGVMVALNTFATSRELDHFIRQSELSFLLMESRIVKQDFLADLLNLCPDLQSVGHQELKVSEYPFLRRIVVLGDNRQLPSLLCWQDFLADSASIEDEFMDAVSENVCPADEGVVFFSSGSTALPKGIIHSHRAASIQWWRWARLLELDPDVRSWTSNGFFWSGNFCVLLGATLVVGGCVVLQRNFDSESALQIMESERISYPFVWPHQMVSLVEAKSFMDRDLSSFKYIDPTWPLAKNPKVALTDWRYPGNSFGCSETITINCSFPASTPAEVRAQTNGVPMPGNTLKIIDPISNQVVPIAESGEICIKGPTLMSGYLKTPLDNSVDDEGFYRTGDGGFVDNEGRLHWEGRLNDVIKTGGANVSPVEVDQVIMQYPGIKVAHTVGVPHETLGELVVACVVEIEGHDIETEALQQFLRERLASYKRPRSILKLQQEDLTFTANAKVRVDALRELAIRLLDA